MPTITEIDSNSDAGGSRNSGISLRPKRKLKLFSSSDKVKIKSKVDDILSNASSILDFTQQLAPLIPVPFIGSIFGSAKVIVDEVQKIRQNKESLAELALRVANLVKDVCETLRAKEEVLLKLVKGGGNGEEEALRMSLKQLYDTVSDISNFTHSLIDQQNSSILKRVVKRTDISSQIVKYNAELDWSLQVFKASSSLRIELQLSQMDKRLQAIDERAKEQRTWDGQYRIYRRADLELLHLLNEEEVKLGVFDGATLEMLSPNYTEFTRERYIAEDTTGRVMRVTWQVGAKDVFKTNLKSLKSLRHLNIAQLEGYSDDDTGEIQFDVVKGDLRPYLGHVQALPMNQRFEEYFRFMSGIIDTLGYVWKHDLRWWGNIDELMYNQRTGRFILGASDDLTPTAPSSNVVRFRGLQSLLDDTPLETTSEPQYPIWTPEPWFDNSMQDSLKEMKSNAQTILDLLFNSSSSSLKSPIPTSSKTNSKISSCAPEVDLTSVLHLWASCQPNRCGYTLDAWPPGKLGSIGYFQKAEGEGSGKQFILLEKIELENMNLVELESGMGRDVKDGIGKVKRYVDFSFDGLTENDIIEIQIDRETQLYTSLEEKAVWKSGLEYLLIHGIEISKQHNVALENIAIVCHVSWYFRATCHPSNIHDRGPDQLENQPPPLYFHIASKAQCLDENESVSWGYFSLDRTPSDNTEGSILMKERMTDRDGMRKFYDSTIGGLSASTVSDCVLYCAQLNAGEARLLEWLHDTYGTHDIGSSGKSRTVHIEEESESI